MNVRTLILCVSASGALGFSLSGALAEDTLYAKLKAFLPPGPDAQLCFARTYDARHLKNHPKQKVTEMVFFLRYTPLGEDEATIIAKDDGDTEKQYFRYDFTLAAKLRDKTETLYASGECGSTGAIACSVECDGGGVVLEPKVNDPATLLIRLDTDYTYIRMTPGCGDESEAIHLKPGEDDKLFKLTKSPLLLCRAMQENLDKRLQEQTESQP